MLACYNCKKFMSESEDCKSCLRPVGGGAWKHAAFEEKDIHESMPTSFPPAEFYGSSR